MLSIATCSLYRAESVPVNADGSTPKVQAACDLGPELLAIITRLVFSIFLTLGFAAGLGLSGGMNIASPIAVRLCEGFFLWSLALVSCATSRRA